MEQENPYDAFHAHGGKLTKEQVAHYVDMIPDFQPWEREYIKRVLERYDVPPYSQYITREEFLKGLEEMRENWKDPIDPAEIERIKKVFLE